MEKQEITTDELRSLIMAEIRRRPECNHIADVAILRPPQLEPHHPNWQPSWTRHGFASAPAIAWEVARELQARFNVI